MTDNPSGTRWQLRVVLATASLRDKPQAVPAHQNSALSVWELYGPEHILF